MKYLLGYPIKMALLLLMVGCSGPENDKIDTERIKEGNPLVVPPCLKK
ncbi:MAG: hypothetical protein LBB63_01190 [Holosporaceae bacterium]|nr:hypothetical protein [Holosporaceae bacterium]